MAFRPIEGAGHWDGDEFVFHEPVEMYVDRDEQPKRMRRLNFAGMTLTDGITREDVVHAMLNALHVEPLPPEGT